MGDQGGPLQRSPGWCNNWAIWLDQIQDLTYPPNAVVDDGLPSSKYNVIKLSGESLQENMTATDWMISTIGYCHSLLIWWFLHRSPRDFNQILTKFGKIFILATFGKIHQIFNRLIQPLDSWSHGSRRPGDAWPAVGDLILAVLIRVSVSG